METLKNRIGNQVEAYPEYKERLLIYEGLEESRGKKKLFLLFFKIIVLL